MDWLHCSGLRGLFICPLRSVGMDPRCDPCCIRHKTLGKLGLDSNGRGLSLIVLILDVVLMGVLFTVLITGKDNIGIMPT